MKIEQTGERRGKFSKALVTINPNVLSAVLLVAGQEGSPAPYLTAALCSHYAKNGIEGFDSLPLEQKQEIFQAMTEACTRALVDKVEEFSLKYSPVKGEA